MQVVNIEYRDGDMEQIARSWPGGVAMNYQLDVNGRVTVFEVRAEVECHWFPSAIVRRASWYERTDDVPTDDSVKPDPMPEPEPEAA